ncbi:MAG: type IV pilus secretin PilQ [Pseudomonadota bacterium]|nr:type IV pilus secretin PilQ [Pseudomonadota bacterium]
MPPLFSCTQAKAVLRLRHAAAALAVSVALGLQPALAQTVPAATNAVQAVSFAGQGPGKVMVTFDLKTPLTQAPAGFSVSNPARIAIDLPDTISGLEKNTISSGEGDLRSVNVVQAGTRTRLVMNLAHPMSFETRLEGTKLIVLLSTSASAEAAPTVERFAALKPVVGESHAVSKIDFRRGSNGEGRVVLDLSDPRVEVDIRRQGRSLLVDFMDSKLAADLEKKLDVHDFGTPVQFVDASASGNMVHLVVQADGNWEHSAYQAERQFVIEVRKTVEDPNKLVQGPNKSYNGDKLSLNFQNVEIRNVLQVIADFTGLNIIASDSVNGSITLRLKDVPWDQALDIILQTRGLTMKREGNVVLISPAEELAAKEKAALEVQNARNDLEPVHTELVQLNYQRGEDILKLITSDKQSMLSKRGSATVDTRTNTLFLHDTDARIEEIRRLISKIDVPVRQVMIEARIVVAKNTFSRQLGVRLGFAGSTTKGNNFYSVTPGLVQPQNTTFGPATTNSFTTAIEPAVNLPVASPAGTIALTLINGSSGNLLSLELSALEADSQGKVVSSPRVITSDKQKATIEQGTEIPYQQNSSSGATNVAFKPATLSLVVTPRITPDGRVAMDLDIKNDAVGAQYSGIPSIDTNRISTQLLVDDGETAVLGGIYKINNTISESKVPGLGDLPWVGNLFKSTDREESKSELLIFITPRVLRDSLAVR